MKLWFQPACMLPSQSLCISPSVSPPGYINSAQGAAATHSWCQCPLEIVSLNSWVITVLRTSSAARRTIAASQQLPGLHNSLLAFAKEISWKWIISHVRPLGEALEAVKRGLKPHIVWHLLENATIITIPKHLFYRVHKGAFASYTSCFFPYWRWHDADTFLLFYAAEPKLHLKWTI